ncbi:MAG TPA: hypothetical protein DCR97_03425 [Deltaproteobacteria bacterium]|nr:hypothetical protein [Deltaproteobacteria bacterium]
MDIYRPLWESHKEHFNDWDTWNYAQSAQKCDHHEEAEQIARYCCERWPHFLLGRQTLAWALYYNHFRDELPPNQPIPKAYWSAAEEVLDLCVKDPHSKYSPFVRIVFSIVHFLEQRQATGENVRKRLDWLGHLEADHLSTLAESFTDKEGKLRETASNLESWYSYMSKALLDGEHYEDCIQLCEKAIASLQKFHYDNDVWFAARIAECKSKLGRTEEALADYQPLVLKLSAWHLHYKIALLLYKLGQRDGALRHGAEAALAFGPLPNKWKLFLFLAVVLQENGQEDLGRRHAQLAANLRRENNWDKVIPKAQQRFEQFKVDFTDATPAKDLSRQLRQHWQKWQLEMLPRHEGFIDRVHKDKPFGFIKAESLPEPVFFKTHSFIGPKEQCVSRTRVKFFIKDSYDKTKERSSTEAIQVTPIA